LLRLGTITGCRDAGWEKADSQLENVGDWRAEHSQYCLMKREVDFSI